MRLALWVVLNEIPDAMNVFGPDCSSWGMPARATSMRTFLNPNGRLGNRWVASGTMMVARILASKWKSMLQFDLMLKDHNRGSGFNAFHLIAYLRMVLVLLVVLSVHATFLAEQPHGSLLPRNQRWEWFTNCICRAARL